MKTTLLLLFIILSLTAFSSSFQKKKQGYLPGAIISLNNDTIYADIKSDKILKLQTAVKFIDDGGKKKTFKPGMINGFYYETEEGKMFFESRDDIRISIFPSKKGNFVHRISNDIYPLYYFETSRMENTGPESVMVAVPHYLVYLDFRWYHYNKDNFEDCDKLFKDVRSLSRDIQNNKYRFEDFPEIVERYCKGVKARK